MPSLPCEYAKDDELPIYIFSSCEKYVAIASSPDDDRKPVTLDVYCVSCPNGEIYQLDISLGRLEMFTGIKIAGIRIDFHPDQPKLAVVYWAKVDVRFQIRCLALDLQTMSLDHVQPSSNEEIRKSKNSAHFRNAMYRLNICYLDVEKVSAWDTADFSSCGHYLRFNRRHVFLLRCSQEESKLPCNKPLMIRPGDDGWSNCFFSVTFWQDLDRIPIYITCGFENKEKDATEMKELTTYPAHLREADFALLIGEEEDSNLRVVFWKGQDPPEIKYLNFTWRDFLSRFRNDFSTKLYALRESAD
jgi:hypothetical protein